MSIVFLPLLTVFTISKVDRRLIKSYCAKKMILAKFMLIKNFIKNIGINKTSFRVLTEMFSQTSHYKASHLSIVRPAASPGGAGNLISRTSAAASEKCQCSVFII